MMYILRKEFVVLWKHCEVSKFLKEVSNIEVERSYYSSRPCTGKLCWNGLISKDTLSGKAACSKCAFCWVTKNLFQAVEYL
jgi:hypothetical protein